MTPALQGHASTRRTLSIGYALGLGLIAIVQWLHSWPSLAEGRVFPNLNNDPTSNPLLEAAHTLVLGGLLYLYLRTLLAWQQRPLGTRDVVELLVPSSLLAWLALPATSTDILFYVSMGRLVVLHAANPFVHTYEEFPDAFSSYLDWPDATMPYGPLLLPFFTLSGWLSQHSVLASLYLLKLVALGFYYGICWVLPRVARGFGRDPAWALFLFALNPLVVLDQMGNGHNDGLMILFGLLALAALQHGRQALGLVLALLSALSKLPGIVLLALVATRLLWRRQWAALARAAAFALPLLALLGALLFPSLEAVMSLTNPTSSSVNSLHQVLFELAARLNGWDDEAPAYERFYDVERGLSVALFCAFFLWRLWRGQQRRELIGLVDEQARILLVLLVAYTAWFLPWYVTWLLPLAALVRQATLRWAVVAYSCSVAVFFAFPSSLLGTGWQVLRTLFAHGVPLVILALNASARTARSSQTARTV